MITKSQALNLKHGNIILQVARLSSVADTYSSIIDFNKRTEHVLIKPLRWKINGKVQTWKSKTRYEFKIPVKHGLYSFGYLTRDNAHLFELGE